MVKNNKGNQRILVILIMLGLVGGLLFFVNQQRAQIDVGVDDQGVSLKVFARTSIEDSVGQELAIVTRGGQPFSTIEFTPPGTPVEGIIQVRVEHTITNTLSDSNIDVTDLAGVFTNPTGGVIDARYDGALTTDPITLLAVDKSFTLAPLGAKVQSSAWFSVTDLDAICNTAGSQVYCTLQLNADYTGVDPNTGVATTLNTFGNRNLKVSGDVCTDGTPWGQCSTVGAGGQFCDAAVAGVDNDLIDCGGPTGCSPANFGPTSCACNPGFFEDNGDAICTPPVCGSTTAGECTGDDAIICDPGCTTESCTSFVACDQCGVAGQTQGAPLGTGFAECSVDFYSNGATSCNIGNGLCQYRDYTGSITVNLAGNN